MQNYAQLYQKKCIRKKNAKYAADYMHKSSNAYFAYTCAPGF